MQVTETVSDGLKREFAIVIDADQIEAEIEAKLKAFAGDMRLPGFRPGKAPMSLLKTRFRKNVLGEVLDERIRSGVQSTLEERGLRPAMEPKIEVTKFEDQGDLEFSVSMETLPDIEPMDFSKLTIERMEPKIPDEDVDEAIERTAEQVVGTRTVDEERPAADGDTLVIDFVGKLDGEPFEGGAAEDYELALGSNTFIPGFEEQLVGAKAGEEKQVTVNFPDEYGAEHLAGKEAVFDVTVKELREKEPVEIGDELATKIGFDDLEALRKAMRERLAEEYRNLARTRMKRELFDKMEEAHEFVVPDGLVEQEFEGIWTQVKQQLEGENADEVREGKTDEELEEEYRAVARRRVRLGLLLSEVGRRNGISVTDEEIGRARQAQAAQFPGQEQLVQQYYTQNPGALAQLQAPILEDKVVDFISELAQVTVKEVSVDELRKAVEADADEKEPGTSA